MNRFAELLDRLAYEPGRNNKLRLITEYFREIADPDRGYALAALTGALSFKHAKPGLIRDLIAERTDPVLFGLSYDYVGDLSETVALMWPKDATRRRLLPRSPTSGGRGGGRRRLNSRRQSAHGLTIPSPLVGEGRRGVARGCPPHHTPTPTLTEVVTTLRTLGKTELPDSSRWLDELDETGRWALLKLVTGAMRIGISARLAKTAAAALGDKDAARGRADVAGSRAALSRPVRLAGRPRRKAGQSRSRAVPPGDAGARDRGHGFRRARSRRLHRRMEMGRHPRAGGRRPRRARPHQARLYSRTGEDITGSFPDLVPSLRLPGAIDGELLVLREGRVQSFNVLQQRLNRKVVSPKLIKEFPIHLRAYDLLGDDENDLRELPFAERRERLETSSASSTIPASISRPPLPSQAGRH